MAYIAEYGFDLKPCHLCLYQRIPYLAVMFASLLAFVFREKPKLWKILIIICAILFFIGATIAFYHVGVEHHWFEGLTSCSSQQQIPKTVEEMRAQLLATPIVRCDVPAFVFLGLSMAGWNMLWSALLGVVTCTYFIKEKSAS